MSRLRLSQSANARERENSSRRCGGDDCVDEEGEYSSSTSNGGTGRSIVMAVPMSNKAHRLLRTRQLRP